MVQIRLFVNAAASASAHDAIKHVGTTIPCFAKSGERLLALLSPFRQSPVHAQGGFDGQRSCL
jgi:hypothetical protein